MPGAADTRCVCHRPSGQPALVRRAGLAVPRTHPRGEVGGAGLLYVRCDATGAPSRRRSVGPPAEQPPFQPFVALLVATYAAAAVRTRFAAPASCSSCTRRRAGAAHVRLELAAYRVVQETLSNVLKHAGDSRARVTVRFRPDALDLEIVDDGGGTVGSSGNGSSRTVLSARRIGHSTACRRAPALRTDTGSKRRTRARRSARWGSARSMVAVSLMRKEAMSRARASRRPCARERAGQEAADRARSCSDCGGHGARARCNRRQRARRRCGARPAR
jgi:hypothetical protein